MEQTHMVRPPASKILLALLLALSAAAVLLLTGCASVSANSQRYIGAPAFPPSDASKVEILRHEPKQPHERLGEIVLKPSGSPDVAEIEKAMREEAAKLGGDAAVLVYDRTQRMGMVVTGGWWVQYARPVYGRVIVAVAIKYKR
ncbi:MAG: hypothetical protein ACHQPI_05035 [Thermoanaerobaculia bacterium]